MWVQDLSTFSLCLSACRYILSVQSVTDRTDTDNTVTDKTDTGNTDTGNTVTDKTDTDKTDTDNTDTDKFRRLGTAAKKTRRNR